MANKPDPTNFVQSLVDELNSLSTVTETYELPTKGRLDNLDSKITLRMMTTYEEKIRTGSKSSFWKTMSNIINRCIVEPKGIDSYNLTVIDFIFLMYKLRIVSYGKDYRVNLTMCPECRHKLKDVTVDLDSLKVVTIDDLDSFAEPFSIKLPRTGWDIQCRLMRTNEYDEIQSEANKILEDFPDYEGDPTVPLRLARQIVSVKGQKLSRVQLDSIVNKIPAEDENVIAQEFNKINMGLDLTAEYVCPHCGKTIYIPLSYTEEFFRPTAE